ncbi:MAG: glycosyltransferase [Flavobacteriales bacterium]|nr:glycosyltransferase [Flavobacteriales bacterium]
MKTPILLLVYNRPKQTSMVLKRLQQCDVKNVFVSADGPKNAEDRMLTEEVESVLNRFDTIFKSKRFSDKNLGCKHAVISGIDWFFNQVDEGIILEDDCLPCPHFFPFVEELLNRYRDERKVMMVGGNNPLGEWQTEGGHFFSRIGTVWGWATWKDRWQTFNSELPEFDHFISSRGFERAFGPTKLAASRLELTRKSLRGEIDTWDYQWNAHMLMNQGVAVIPERNLVENIGFENSGTNINSKPNWIVNEVSNEPLKIGSQKLHSDREFEVEWELARRSNLPGNTSSKSFQEKGEKEKRRWKILIINSTDMGGGAEKIAFTLHEQLLALGHDSQLLVQVKKSDLDSIQEIADWKSQIENFQPDVIHIHNLHGTSIPLDVLSEISRSIPVFFTLHDSWLATGSTEHPFEPEPEKLNLLELLEWQKEFTHRHEVISNSNFCFTAPSQWMRELFFNAHGIRPFFVPNSIEKVAPSEIEIPSKRFILFVANRPETNPYKDFATLKKAWKKANETQGEYGCDLIVLGGEPKTEKVGNRTLFIIEKQSTENVLAFIEKSLLVIQASLQDNAPLTILEAHSVGKSLVGSLVGGIPELMDEEEKEWLYEAESADDLCEKLIAALQSETRGRETRDKETCSICSIESIVNTYLGHYLSLQSRQLSQS